jgi:aminopeptidase
MTLEQRLEAYADLTVRVALNVRAGQRLLIVGPLMNGGVSLDAAPLVREVAASAYRAGASLVEAVWGDEAMQLARFRHAPHDSFKQLFRLAAQLRWPITPTPGGAVLSVYCNDPDLLEHAPADRAGALQQATSRSVMGFRELISRNHTNWAGCRRAPCRVGQESLS